MLQNTLFAFAPTDLVLVRRLCHAAIQWPSRAARANIKPKTDDSHSNLGWDTEYDALVSHHLDSSRYYQMGFSFASQSLLLIKNSEVVDSFDLKNANESEAKRWTDQSLVSANLIDTNGVKMPYELDPLDYAGFIKPDALRQTQTLGGWYASAHKVLTELVDQFQSISVSPPSVRCWPHHFDLASLFLLDDEDPELARSIGAGLSPGDETFAEPYFYCSPWPVPGSLPPAPALTHWHVEGFTSLICPASRLDEKTDIVAVLRDAFEVVKSRLSND